MTDKVSPDLTVYVTGPWCAAGWTMIVAAVRVLASQMRGILDMSGFLLRFGPTQKGPGRVLQHLAGTAWLVGEIREGRLLPALIEDVFESRESLFSFSK